MMNCAVYIAADFGKAGGKFKTFNAKTQRHEGKAKKNG